MKYRMLIADLDGTVLDGQKRIPEANLHALRRLVEQGVKVIFCTGRMICAAQPFWEQVEPETPIVGYNGALAKNPRDTKPLYEKPIPPEVAVQAIRDCKALGREVFGYWGDRMFIERVTPHVERYAATYRVDFTVVQSLEERLSNGATKLLMPCEPEECRGLLNLTRERFGERFNITSTEGRHVELLAKGVSKSAAVEFLSRMYGIPREEIVAVGDGINDIDLIQYAGLGAAVANAVDELKQAADIVVSSNENSGVAELINKLEWGKK